MSEIKVREKVEKVSSKSKIKITSIEEIKKEFIEVFLAGILIHEYENYMKRNEEPIIKHKNFKEFLENEDHYGMPYKSRNYDSDGSVILEKSDDSCLDFLIMEIKNNVRGHYHVEEFDINGFMDFLSEIKFSNLFFLNPSEHIKNKLYEYFEVN